MRFGLRFESVSGDDDEATIVDDEAIAPRVAISYDPRGDGKVLLQAAWGRYYEPFLQQYLDSFSLIDPLTGYTAYLWAGNPFSRFQELGIFNPACVGRDPSNVDDPCWVAPMEEAAVPLQFSQRNPSLERASVDELVLGFERWLSPRAGLSIHYVDRRWRNLWNGRLDLDENGRPVTEVTRVPGAKRAYKAVQMIFQRRYAERWQLLASYTWSEAEGNFFVNDGLGTLADFSAFTDTNVVNRFGPAPYDRPHQFRIFGTYHLPFERFGLSLAAALRYSDGVPYQLEVLETIDLPFLPPEEDPVSVRFVTPRGSERLSGNFRLDTALNLDVRLAGEVDFELKAEIFNLTGEQEQLGAETLLDTGLAGLPRALGDLQAPRSYRVTLGLRF